MNRCPIETKRIVEELPISEVTRQDEVWELPDSQIADLRPGCWIVKGDARRDVARAQVPEVTELGAHSAEVSKRLTKNGTVFRLRFLGKGHSQVGQGRLALVR